MAYYNKNIIKDQVDIIDLARRFYGVDFSQEVGNTAKCCCPFHVEKTPSCVFTGLGSGENSSRFHCFGCGADGDLIDFVMKQDGVSMTDACEKIVSVYNLDRSVICQEGSDGKKSEAIANQANKNIKVSVDAITKLQDSYARGEISGDEYDSKLSPLMKMYEENLSKAYKGKKIGSDEKNAFLNAFKARIPKWLDQGSPVYRNGMVIKGKEMPLYTKKGTKLCDKFSQIIVSPGEKGIFGAFVEMDPSPDIVLQEKDIHPDDAWKISSEHKDKDGKYKVYSLRYNAPDFSGCTICVQHEPIFTNDKRTVMVDGKSVEKSYPPIFQKDKWYVDVHDVLDIKTLQRLLPEKFPSIELPEFLDHECFRPNMCIAYKTKGQDIICKYKLFINDTHVYINESKWSQNTIGQCLEASGNNMDKFEDQLFDTADVRIIELNSSEFEKYCKFMKQCADKNPAVLNTDDDCVRFIANLSAQAKEDRTTGRN